MPAVSHCRLRQVMTCFVAEPTDTNTSVPRKKNSRCHLLHGDDRAGHLEVVHTSDRQGDSRNSRHERCHDENSFLEVFNRS